MTACPEQDEPPFRNGRPVRMSGWLHLKVGRLGRRVSRYANLLGEVMCFHLNETSPPEDQFDVTESAIEFSPTDNRRNFRIITNRRVYTCFCNTVEEAQSWGHSLSFAVNHIFDHYYTLGTSIAEGTFSRVYHAYANDDPDQVFAVKIVKKRAHDTQALEWLRRERHVNAMLFHPTIVQAVDMFSTMEKDYLVFELMRGGTLADLLEKRKKLPESYARVVMRELFTALNYVHSKNIVHRDVRPDNIFCSATKFPMSIALGDFGLSNFLSEKRVNPDVLTSMLGTPPYISIDIVRRIKYGPVADMWSAGVVLYQLLSGELPFTGRSDREVIEMIKRGNVNFTGAPWKNISADAKQLVRQLLQTDPFKRISALASLQHPWLKSSRPVSGAASCATSPPDSSNIGFADRDSPHTSVDGRRSSGFIIPSLSNFSRVPSSTSSASQSRDISADISGDWFERQKSSLGFQMQQPSLRSMHAVSSLSSLSGAVGAGGRMHMTPSVRAIAERGLQRVASDNPAKMKRLLSSRVVQKQLAVTLRYRRKLVVTARAFVAVFRLQALTRGHSATRQLSVLGKGSVEGVNHIIDKRKKAWEEARGSCDIDGPISKVAAKKSSDGNGRQRKE